MKLTIPHIDESIAKALIGESRLDPAVLDILGFATPTMRRLFSNLCHVEGLTYLEIGTYCGATFCSAFSNNPIHAIGIDNFSQTWAPGRDIAGEFAENLHRYVEMNFPRSYQFYRDDCFNPELLDQIGKGLDIFYYDGDHTREATAKALPHFFDLLSDTFLVIFDDWCWTEQVQRGAEDGFLAVNSKVIKAWELIGDTRQDDLVWHNGVAMFLCKKL